MLHCNIGKTRRRQVAEMVAPKRLQGALAARRQHDDWLMRAINDCHRISKR